MTYRLTKGRKALMDRHDEISAVRAYWNRRLRSGRALCNFNIFEEGHDYFGPEPWPSLISLDAAHRDYMLEYGGEVPLPRIRFANLYRAVLGIDRGTSKGKDARTPDGIRLFPKSCVYYDIARHRPRATGSGHGRPHGAATA
jgi:hypothetical protein